MIADIGARMMNFDRLVYLKNICHIKKVYNSDRYIDNLLKSMEALKSYQIYTWHLRPFLTPPHTHTRTHIYTTTLSHPAPLDVKIGVDSISIYSMQKELYITGINENGFFKYDKQYSEFKINRLNKYYFTIKIGNGYLSAKPDGGYYIQSIARE